MSKLSQSLANTAFVVVLNKGETVYNYFGITQLMAGGGVALIGMLLIPQLSTLFA